MNLSSTFFSRAPRRGEVFCCSIALILLALSLPAGSLAAGKDAPQVGDLTMPALSGTWELEIPKKWAVKGKGFVLLERDGTFRLIAIGEVAGRRFERA